MGCLGQSSTTTNGGNNDASKTEEKKILVVVGPTGAGKDSIMKIEVQTNKNQFKKAVFHTTREKRKGEKEGVDYYFVSKDDFTKMKENKELIESKYNQDDGYLYGISVKELQDGLKSDEIVYCIIDIDGANAIKKLNIPANYVSTLPPSEEELKKRLESKKSEAKEQINTQLETAKKELKTIKDNALFNIKIINDDLKTAASDLQSQLKNYYPQLKITVGSS